MNAATALLGNSVKKDIIFLDVDALQHGKFHIELDRHFTVVSDDSGTGKSLLCEIIKNRKRNRIRVESSLPLRIVNEISDLSSIKEKSLILMDENADCVIDNAKELQQIINSSDNVFLLFIRDDAFPKISYSVDDVKVFRKSNHKITLANKYPIFYVKES